MGISVVPGSGLWAPLEILLIHSCSMGGWAVSLLSAPGLQVLGGATTALCPSLSTPPPLNRGLLALWLPLVSAAGGLLGPCFNWGRESFSRKARQDQCQIASCSQPTCPANLYHT